MGHRSNALEYIYAADLLILPSRAEAMPRVILEAMAIETPVVATAVDGIPELIDHEKSGLLFEPEDIGGMIDSIDRIYTNPQMTEQFCSAARAKYWSCFSRIHQKARYRQVLEKIVNQPN